jgi:CRISPR-associated endonuclease/helicase Cas3
MMPPSPQETPFLRPFQQRVFDLVMQGKRVILQAPTGAGKTRAALAPFVESLIQWQLAQMRPSTQQGIWYEGELPLTCRYAVPVRVLANQFEHEYHTVAARIDRSIGSQLEQRYQALGHKAIALQTGETPDDPQFESLLTFCTIDQLLASALAIPYSMGTNRANLNVAAVAGSYLILDEFHLYPLLREGKSVFGARTTTLFLLRLFASLTPFVLMTATFSSTLLQRLATLLDAEIVKVTDDELKCINQGRSRTFHRSPAPMQAETLLAEHCQRESRGNHCTLIVCNTVFRAQRLFLQLRAIVPATTRVVLLHSRFSAQDRQRLSQEIEQELGPEHWEQGVYTGQDLIVIATQVVEVGLNISVQALHTELAPANSLVQRAGRCARFAQQQGHVTVYPLPLDEQGKASSTLPYDPKVCEATWTALTTFDGQQVGFHEEQDLIDCVHTEEDQALLDGYERNEQQIRKQLFESLNSNDRGVASTLVRDVLQVQILIHDEPDETITQTPWQWQSFGVHPSLLLKPARWQALQERSNALDLEWTCKQAIAVKVGKKDEDADSLDSRQQIHYQWQEVTNSREILSASMIVLPHQLASYDHELGFVLLDGELPVEPGDYQSVKLPTSSSDTGRGGSRVTSYQGHIAGLLRAYHMGIKDEISYMARKLEEAMELPTGMIDQAIRLAIACHDLGKLNQRWQQWALAWQQELYKRQGRPPYAPPSPAFCFAKTDFNYSREQQEWQREVTPKRPNHACESVAIGRSLIGTSLGITKTSGQAYWPVLRAICGAIARHHTAQARQFSPVTLDAAVLKAAEEALAHVHMGSAWSYDVKRLNPRIKEGGDLAPEAAPTIKVTRPAWEGGRADELETWLYFVIVRALRLADQRA